MARGKITLDDVYKVLERADAPLATLELGSRLARTRNIEIDDLNWQALRRALTALEKTEYVVASGGPKREKRAGWPEAEDGREVYWTTIYHAAAIERAVTREDEKTEQRRRTRADYLRELFSVTGRAEREALGLIGIHRALRTELDYRTETGAPSWSNEELHAVLTAIGAWD